MEGAAGAHVCVLYGVPFLEIRGVSNLVGDRDRTSWQVERAAAVAARAALAATAALAVFVSQDTDPGRRRSVREGPGA